jgi:broad specificity phosphatase PhoE
MNIYLIRHGEKQDDGKNHCMLGLTPKGFKQANVLGQRLVKYNIANLHK